MILADPFEDTNKSILNISAKIIDVIHNRKVNKFEKVISTVENELETTYDKVILSLNFLYMTGTLEYEKYTDILRFNNENK
jgi:hypothetical protein